MGSSKLDKVDNGFDLETTSCSTWGPLAKFHLNLENLHNFTSFPGCYSIVLRLGSAHARCVIYEIWYAHTRLSGRKRNYSKLQKQWQRGRLMFPVMTFCQNQMERWHEVAAAEARRQRNRKLDETLLHTRVENKSRNSAVLRTLQYKLKSYPLKCDAVHRSWSALARLYTWSYR